jgi:magnesium-transporting ATPase (P-type)
VVAPLLATQILWINLLTDSAPALAMGVDPPPGDVMRRPPRKLTDRVTDRQMQLGVLLVGLVTALATLLTIDLKLPGGLVEGSASLVEARTAGFTVLVLAQLFNTFNSGSDRTSAFRGSSATAGCGPRSPCRCCCRCWWCTCRSSTGRSAQRRCRPAAGRCAWPWPAWCCGPTS